MTAGLDFSSFSDGIAEWLGVAQENFHNFLATLLIVVGYVLARRVTLRMIGGRFEEPQTRYRFNKATQAILAGVALFVLVKIWFQGVQFGTYLGLVSAGLAVALQDPLVNFVGWLFIVARSPFRVGDRIQIGPHAGDVVDLQLMSFTLLEIGNWVHADQSTGRVIHVPNGWVFKHPLASYSGGFPFIWNEIQVAITFESDWRAAKKALEQILNDKAEKVDDQHFDRPSHGLDIRYSRLTPVVWVSTSADGVVLTMRYLCKPRERRVSSSRMWEAVLVRFDQMPAVDLAYTTTRFYDAAREGGVRKQPRPMDSSPPPSEPPSPAED